MCEKHVLKSRAVGPALWLSAAACASQRTSAMLDVMHIPAQKPEIASVSFGSDTSSNPVLIQPMSVATIKGQVFVLDDADKKIKGFDEEGRLLLVFGGNGRAPDQLERPLDMNAAGAHLYVLDSGNRALKKYEQSGELIECIPIPRTEGSAVLSFACNSNGVLFLNPISIGAHHVINMYATPDSTPVGVGEEVDEIESLTDFGAFYRTFGWMDYDDIAGVLTFPYCLDDRILRINQKGYVMRELSLGLRSPDIQLSRAPGAQAATMLDSALYSDLDSEEGTTYVLYADGTEGRKQGNQVAVIDHDDRLVARIALQTPAARLCVSHTGLLMTIDVEDARLVSYRLQHIERIHDQS